MIVKSNITIIIPSYNRPLYLKRSISFWKLCDYNLIIVDGSNVSNEDAIGIENYKNIRYFHNPVSLEDRIFFAMSKVETDFVAIIPDDEFYLPSALEQARDILESMPDVVFVAGATLGFVGLDSKFAVKHQYKGNLKLKIDSNSPLSRLGQRFKYTDSTIYYGLRRLKDFTKIINFISENKYSCPYIQEMQIEVATILLGKVYFIKKLMWFRCNDSPPISRIGFDRNYQLGDWFLDCKMKTERELLNKSLIDFGCDNSSHNMTLDYIMAMYLARDRKHLNIGGFDGEAFLNKIKRSLHEISRTVIDREYLMALLIAFQRIYSLVYYKDSRRGYSPLWLAVFELRYCFGIFVDQRELKLVVETVKAARLPLNQK